MIERTYSTEIDDQDWFAEWPLQSGRLFIRRALVRLFARSGAVHVPRTARVTEERRPENRTSILQITFNSRAWTGRY